MALKYDLVNLQLCEFEYENEELLYIGKEKGNSPIPCHKCGRDTKKPHYFVLVEDEEEARYFGNDCVSYVFGTVGLKEDIE